MRTLLLFPLLMLLTMLPAAGQSRQDAPEERAAKGGGDRLMGRPFATRSPVVAQRGMAATSQPLASQTAVDILKKGGSAVDAAIAANAALGLMEPTGNGLGGDLFAIVWDPEADSVYGLNASGRSSQALTYEAMQRELGALGRDEIPLWGPLPVSVPGAVDGWFMLHERFGKLPMDEVLAPAIRYAEEGFPVSQVIAYYWQMNLERFQEEQGLIPAFENARATFFIEDGDSLRAPQEGELFRNPDLARTLRLLAENGRDAFYRGAIADTIDAFMREIGGYLSKGDLAAHEGEWVKPISTTYRSAEVYELPPNGQGLAALQMLNILEAYNLDSLGHNTADYLHLHAEAKKLAFEDRARFYADPAFYDAPIERLLSKDYAAGRRDLIRPGQALQQIETVSAERLDGGDTIYLTVADSSGMMVSLIQSNYVGMGSGLVPPGLGFMLQDRGALFTMEKGHANAYAPGKRPFHTIIPAFATKDGQPFLSFGVMGGAMQPQGHVQVLCNILDFGMNVQEAGDAARYRHTGSSQPTGGTMTDGGTLFLESGIPGEVAEALRRRGHEAAYRVGGFGGYQAIRYDAERGVYFGASEMRKDGHVAGY